MYRPPLPDDRRPDRRLPFMAAWVSSESLIRLRSFTNLNFTHPAVVYSLFVRIVLVLAPTAPRAIIFTQTRAHHSMRVRISSPRCLLPPANLASPRHGNYGRSR